MILTLYRVLREEACLSGDEDLVHDHGLGAGAAEGAGESVGLWCDG